MFPRFRYVFHFRLLLFLSIIYFVHGNDPNIAEFEIIKVSLRPLKYFKNCAEFCENIICNPIKECNDGVILKNESYCKCCEAYVKFLDVGENCTELIEGSLALGAQSRCKYGTACENGRCQLNTEKKTCLRDRDIREKHIETGNYAPDMWLPECDEEGHYKAKQKQNTKSMCVDKSGKKIFGGADDLLKNTCACSRLMKEKFEKDPVSFQAKPHEHCTSSGSFDNLQCIDNLCYCADNDTGDVASELVRFDFLHNLHCFDAKIHQKNCVKECETELQRTRKLAYEFAKKGVKIHGIDVVTCDPDGTFSQKQCVPDRCICTDNEGIQIAHYASETKTNMTCACARDGIAEAFMSFSCQTNGNYTPFTCFDSACVCVDENGDIISNARNKTSENSEESYCDTLNRNLLEYPKKDEDVFSTDSDYEYL